jgi:hypothetical protein
MCLRANKKKQKRPAPPGFQDPRRANRVLADSEHHIRASILERAAMLRMAESDLLSLHEGNFARLGVRPSEFSAWQVAWENKELIFPAPEER